jgi:hypothetical protein
MRRTLVVMACAALALSCGKKESPQNLATVAFELKTQPAYGFRLNEEGLVLPEGIAAVVKITPKQAGNADFTHAFSIESMDPGVFALRPLDKPNEYILFGSQLGLGVLRVRPTDTTNVKDTGEVIIPVAVTEQDGDLYGPPTGFRGPDAGAADAARDAAPAPADAGPDSSSDAPAD